MMLPETFQFEAVKPVGCVKWRLESDDGGIKAEVTLEPDITGVTGLRVGIRTAGRINLSRGDGHAHIAVGRDWRCRCFA